MPIFLLRNKMVMGIGHIYPIIYMTSPARSLPSFIPKTWRSISKGKGKK